MKSAVEKLVRDALSELHELAELSELATQSLIVERTRDRKDGDFTTNVAMRLAKPARRKPRELAEAIVRLIPASPLVAKTEIAGPGFVNFTMSADAYADEIISTLQQDELYGHTNPAGDLPVIVEYISANPTGPLHVGHGRHAAYGASVCNLLRATGHRVHQEYYVNDAGRQMDILAFSVWMRYLQQLGLDAIMPDGCYQGLYIVKIAKQLVQTHAGALQKDPADWGIADDNPDAALDALIAQAKRELGADAFREILDTALASVLGDIRQDLTEFGVEPDQWFSERTLTANAIPHALEILKQNNQLYTKDGATWFRASDYGDEKDRVVVRENGASTYFASDIAYHLHKRERGFELLLDILGADHHGYVARVRAGLEAVAQPPESLEVQLVQFVALFRSGRKMQMSTRSGEFVTLRELREEVGNDAARFFYCMRSNEQHLDFDLDLAKSSSDDNPVYYVQYAHARVCSVFTQLEERGLTWGETNGVACLSELSESREQALMATLSRFPEVVELAAANRAPHHVVHYLRDVGNDFHSLYGAHKILVDDAAVRDARLALLSATRIVIRNGLALLGVSAPQSM